MKKTTTLNFHRFPQITIASLLVALACCWSGIIHASSLPAVHGNEENSQKNNTNATERVFIEEIVAATQQTCEVPPLAFNYQANFSSESTLGVTDPAFRPSGTTNFIVGEAGRKLIFIKKAGLPRGDFGVDFAFNLSNRFCFSADVDVAFPSNGTLAAGLIASDGINSIRIYFTSPGRVYFTDCGPGAGCGGGSCSCGGGRGVVNPRIFVQRNGPEVKVFGFTSNGRENLWQRNMSGPVHIRMFMLTEQDVLGEASCGFSNVNITADGVVSSQGQHSSISKAVKVTILSEYGRLFIVERSSSLDPNEWQPWIGPTLGTGNSFIFWDDAILSNQSYRSRIVGE